jgi:acyl-CoA reductase-like NAD-dependent aldehyde dehydrogenase
VIPPSNIGVYSIVEIARVAIPGNLVRSRLSSRADTLAGLVQDVFYEGLPGRVRIDRNLSGPEFLSRALDDAIVPYLAVWGGERLGDVMWARLAELPDKRILFEGPGKDPSLILEGADAERASGQLVEAKFRFSGQECVAPENVILHRSVHDRIVENLVDACRRAEVAPLMSRDVPGIVAEQLADATRHGAQIVIGGAVDGQTVAPTVVTGVTPAMMLFQDETFAPVFAICVADSDDDAVDLARDTRFGLRASVVGTDAERVGDALRGAAYAEPVDELTYGRFGTVAINRVAENGESGPVFGGYGKSGWLWDRGQLRQGPKSVAKEATSP